MTIRLSQQYVDVAGTFTDGELRVHRQYISVLTQGVAGTTDIPVSANNTLNLTDNTVGQRVLNVLDTLNITDNAVYVPLVQLQDTLNLTDNVTLVRDFGVSFSDSLNLSDSAQKAVPVSANNTLAFNDTDYSWQFLIIEDRKIAYDTLNFQQTVFTLSSIDLSNTLNFQQTVNGYNTSRRVSASNHIFFQQARLPQNHRVWVEDPVGITDRVNIPIIRAIAQTLNLTDTGTMTNLFDVLVFSHSAQFGFGLVVSNTLNLTQNMSVQALFNRTVLDDLGIGHSLTWYDDTPCSRKQYTPFQGEDTTGGPTAPPNELPYVQVSPMTDRMLLYYPAIGPATYSVTLRAPEMDNRDRNAYTRVTRETMGGKLIVYADPTWPKVRTMVVTIIGLKTTQAAEYQTFIRNTLGMEIGVTDWEGRMWAGVIVNPEEPVTQDGRESWTITFSMECELLDGQFPNSGSLGITDSVSYEIV